MLYFKMAKKQDIPNWAWIIVALLLLIFLNQQGAFNKFTQPYQFVTNETVVQILEGPTYTIPEMTCVLSLTPTKMDAGDTVVGRIVTDPITFCQVYAKPTDGDWSLVFEGTTDIDGVLQQSETILIEGIFTFKAICGDCITNIETLDTTPGPTPPICVDSDGEDEFTFGWVDNVAEATSTPDTCLDADTVIEQLCVGDLFASKLIDCPVTHKCEGGKCILRTGYSIGDIVFYYGKTWDSLDGGYSVDLHLDTANIETGGPCRLGARISRSWDYAVPGCEGSVGTVDWTLFDSAGYRWGVYDTSPTTQTVEVCPCSWDGVTNWYFEVINTKSPNCPVNFEYDFTIFVCECD